MSADVSAVPAQEIEAAVPGGVTHFAFQAKVFTVPGARFSYLPNTTTPRFFARMGGMEVSMAIDALKSEFKIKPDSPDGRLIETAVSGLKYVAEIRPGDVIPGELLDGRASWSVKPVHRLLAERRLQIQLLSWVSGKEIVISDADQIATFLEQLENKQKLRDAFEKAAITLGRDKSDWEAVLEQIGVLGCELSYIEALRVRFERIKALVDRLMTLRRTVGSDNRTRDELHRVIVLVARASAHYDQMFADVDAQTGEVIGALKSLDRQVKYIRSARNELHIITKDWDPLLARWSEDIQKRSRVMTILIADTYRFVASRFASSRSLMKKVAAGDGKQAKD